MATTRYPRRGHRLAPATLQEFLQAPVPAKYLVNEADAGLRLCDLDESAWQRFDVPACHALAKEVLRAVTLAVRMPTADRRLPSIPRGLKLTDLDLEARTINCLVSAGIDRRPQDLHSLTIDGLLGLRGFWVKCLVDLLTALEHASDHPEARRALQQAQGTKAVGRPRVSCRYPREGDRLAPQTLSDVLAVPVPPGVTGDVPVGDMKLFELDEGVWKQFSRESIDQLAELIVGRLNVTATNRTLGRRRLPKPPRGMRLDDLRLENRTHNCLRRQGFDKRPSDLGNRTVGQMLAIRAFGAKCLVDLLSSLEGLISRAGKLDERLTAEAVALGKMPQAQRIQFSDPRLGPLLRATHPEADTVGELVSHLVKRRLDPPDPVTLCERVCEVRRRITALSVLSLEEELIEILASSASGRDRQILAEYHGWDGAGGRTLEELGRKHGLSRERVRQVCVHAARRNRQTDVFAPVLDRTLEFISGRLPASADRLKAAFDAAGFSQCGLPLEAVQEAALLLLRRPQFAVVAVGESRLAVTPGEERIPPWIVQIAKRSVLSYGAATICEVAAEVSSQCEAKVSQGLVTETLGALPDFQWLDEKQGWFQLASLPQYGLPNLIEKILSVTGKIDVSKLREAIGRYRRTCRKVPPGGVLLEFCRRLQGVRVAGSTILADPPRDWREVLGGVEAKMVQVLEEHGPVMERGLLEDHCLGAGMNRFSFNAIIMSSPVIVRFGRSVYGLLGARVTQTMTGSLAARCSDSPPARVLQGYGQADEGSFYLAYRLSKAAIAGGVMTVPAAMKGKVQGKFTIRTADGQAEGTLVSKNGCAWGLGPMLRSRQAEPGDRLLIVFDFGARDALVYLGDESVAAPVPGPHGYPGRRSSGTSGTAF